MTLAFVEAATLEAAVALVTAIGAQTRYARDGVALPRCGHPRWWLTGPTLARHRDAVSRRGVVPRCVCTARDAPSPRCPHVTWQAASVLALADGTLLVQAEEAALAALPEPRPPRRAPTLEEREASEEVWTLRAERAGAGSDR